MTARFDNLTFPYAANLAESRGRMMKAIISAALVCAALSGCSSSALMVERPPVTAYRATTATLVYEPATIAVEDATQAHLQRRMAEELVDGPKAVFRPGNDLTIRYHFVGHNEGSRVGRYLSMGLAGGSKSYVEATFFDASGQQIGQVRAEGAVGMGVAGGSAKSGVDGAVKRIADYAAATFKR